MKLLWNAAFEGIYVDGSTDGKNEKQLGMAEEQAFVSATMRALAKIASKPVGHDLLDLISKRCRGIGTKLKGGQLTIKYGTGSMFPGEIWESKAILESTFARAANFAASRRTTTPVRVSTFGGTVALNGITRAGEGSSAMVVYNPFLAAGEVYFCEADVTLFELLGVECPAFICLAHELCHALHILSGDGKTYPLPEEPWTIGAGKWANTRISENAIRKEHGIALRQYYCTPGDCG